MMTRSREGSKEEASARVGTSWASKDISDETNSTEPSQISETTKLRLDLQAMELAEQKKKYEEAQNSHQEELVRIQTLKELKKEKGEQKKTELKMRQRRHGKWRVSARVEPDPAIGGWHSRRW
jgi:hypothetical protein